MQEKLEKSVFYLENSCFKSGNSSGKVSTMLGWMLRMMRSSGALKSCEPRKKNNNLIIYFIFSFTQLHAFLGKDNFSWLGKRYGLFHWGTLKLMG